MFFAVDDTANVVRVVHIRRGARQRPTSGEPKKRVALPDSAWAAFGHRQLTDQLAQLRKFRARKSAQRRPRGPLDPRQVGPELLEAPLGQAVGDDAVRGEQCTGIASD